MRNIGYYAWSELWPDEFEQKFVNFPVFAGDEIYAGVWIGDNRGQPTGSPTHYGFWMENLTRKATTMGTSVLGSKKIVGREAVWILESPVFADKFGLANYSTATMSNAHARRAGSPAGQGFVSYGNDPNAELRQLRMTSNGKPTGTTLSTVAPVDANTMRFQWSAFR